MTTGQKLVENSSLPNGATALQHLLNPSGVGGGETVFIPIEQFDVDMNIDTFGADLDIISLSADIKIESFDADLTEDTLSADLTMENYDVVD